jgi:ribosomal protein RSM22 (predicted rRNA methylase)
VILEAGNPQGSHTVRSARQFILDSFNFESDEQKKKKKKSETFSKFKINKNEKNDKNDKTDKNDKNEVKFEKDSIEYERKKESSKDVDDVMTMILPAPGGRRHEDFGAFTVAPCTHDKVCIHVYVIYIYIYIYVHNIF